MLDMAETFCEDVGYHIISPNKPEIDCPVSNALLDEVISNVNVFCHHVIDGVLGQEISGMIVDMWSGRNLSTLV